jgi:hypothetical protein
MKRIAACVLAGIAAFAAPAGATGSIECATPDGTVSIDLAIGTLDVLSVQHARIVAGDEVWSTMPESDAQTAIMVGQQFRDEARTLVDFTDPNVEAVIAQLRLQMASEGRDMAVAGTLRVAGSGAWPLVCVGP